jgi:phage N-6-adenine-methyltransferase
MKHKMDEAFVNVGHGVHFSSQSHDWQTPPDLFAVLHKEFGFTMDACAEAHNAQLPDYFSPANSALTKFWYGRLWMNPPHGREIGRWVGKAFGEVYAGRAELVVCLTPARTDTSWFWKYCRHAEVRFLPGRLHFWADGKPVGNGAPFPSIITVFERARTARMICWNWREGL